MKKLHLRLELGRMIKKNIRGLPRELKLSRRLNYSGSVSSPGREAEHGREVRGPAGAETTPAGAETTATIMNLKDTKDPKGPAGAETTAIMTTGIVSRCGEGERVAEGRAAAVSVTIIRIKTAIGKIHGLRGREVLGTPDTAVGEEDGTAEVEELGVKEVTRAEVEDHGEEAIAEVEEEGVVNGSKKT